MVSVWFGDQAEQGVAVFVVADEQGLIGGQPQQRFQMRVERADDVLRVGDLHGVGAEQPPHRLFIEALAAAFLLGPQAERDLAADALLEDGGFALEQIIEVLLVAAADDVAHEVEKFRQPAAPLLPSGLIAFTPKPRHRFSSVADIAVVLRHERHAAVVLPALRTADPVGAQRDALQFAFLVQIDVPVLVLQRHEVVDRLRHHDGFAAGKFLQFAERHDAGLAADRQHRVHLVQALQVAFGARRNLALGTVAPLSRLLLGLAIVVPARALSRVRLQLACRAPPPGTPPFFSRAP